jgi:O-antigen ligase
LAASDWRKSVPNSARSAVAPLYLFACLLLGGSAQGIWQNAVLQLAGIAIIAWAAASDSPEAMPRRAKALLLLAVAAIAVVALQLVPLPASLWAQGNRMSIAEGYRLLGQPAPSLPLSLTPAASMSTLLCIIPPLALFCAMVRLRAYRATWLAAALAAGTVLGIMLGALQVASSGGGSLWYLYPETNIGAGVGFFANANHMATLLIVTLPFLAAIGASGRSRSKQRDSALLSLVAAAGLLVVVGIVLNRSLAGYLLLLPVLVASALVLVPRGSRLRGWLAISVVLLVIAAIGALSSSSIGGTRIGQDAPVSVHSRTQILKTTGKAMADYMPFGSGLGSFVNIYRLYENPDAVTAEYVVHAHNDYAEIALELGIPGIVLMVVFLVWWFREIWSVWRRGERGAFAKAASIASAAILLHSIVDFPLRTAAISACFAMCLALLADRRTQPPHQETQDLRPTRHLVIR